jgi:hypothetical protein
MDSLQAQFTRLAHETLCQLPMAIPPESHVVELDLAVILEVKERRLVFYHTVVVKDWGIATLAMKR